jgi:hypothetical protein
VSQPEVPIVEHKERLLPSPTVWVAVLAISASLGLTAVRPLGWAVGLGVALLAVAAATLALLASSARVEVRGGMLRAGTARIELEHLGRVAVVTPKRMAELRGPKADARAYLCQRAWIRAGVVAEVVDPQDPVPYWLMSSRQPERLVAALRAGGAGSAHDEPSDGSGQAHSRHTG